MIKSEVEEQNKEAENKEEDSQKESVPAETLTKETKNVFGIDVEEMTKAGVSFGHQVSRLHPKMKLYLAGVRNTVHIIDLDSTAKKLSEALIFIEKLISEDKVILLVGTKIQVKDLVQETAEACELPYINERWLGGTLTNFPIITKRVNYLKDLEEKKAKGELEKYTKKERVKINKEFQKLLVKFGGMKKLERLPDAIFVLDIRKDDLAVKEAKIKGIKVIAICDTNVDPTLVDYPIPANDDAVLSVKYILGKFKEVILKAKSKAK